MRSRFNSSLDSLVRPLSAAEQSLELLNQTSSSYNVTTVSVLRGLLALETLQQALNLTLQRSPPLRSIIKGDLNNLRFEINPTPYIPLRHQTLKHPDAWQDVVQTELNTKVSSERFLMRVVLAQEENSEVSYLVTTIHHAISDGLSSIHLHQAILRDCQTIVAGGSPDVQPVPVLPPAEALLPSRNQGFRGKAKSILYVLQLKRRYRRHRAQSLPFERTVPISERQCGYLYRTVNSSMTRRLVERCREEKASVQAALCAAILLSLAEPLGVSSKTKEIPVVCRSFVDLRRHFTPAVSPENLCLLASSLSTFHTLTAQHDFWELAREVKEQLNSGIVRRQMFSVLPLARRIVEALLEQANESPSTAAITNVGQVKLANQYGSLKLESIGMMFSQATFGGTFSAAVTTFRGVMHLHFVFSVPSISYPTAASLADTMLLYLERAATP